MDSEVSARVRIELPHARAWQLLRQLELADRYVPGVTGCTLSSGVQISGTIKADGTTREPEEIPEKEPGGDKAPLPFAQARFAYRIVEADARSTDAELSLSYTLRGGALGQAVDALLLRAAMQKQVEAVASAMKLFYETEA